MCTNSLITCGYVLLMACGVTLSALALFYPAGIIIDKASPIFKNCITQGDASDPCNKANEILSSDIIPFSCSFASLFNILDSKDFTKFDNKCKDYMDKVDDKIKTIWYSAAIGVGISAIGIIAGVIVIVVFSCCACLRVIPMIALTILGLALTAVMAAFVICYHDKWDYLQDETTRLIPALQGTNMFQNTFWFGIGATAAGGVSAILAFLGIFTSFSCC
uniref:Claudin-like protein n=1 Tax=Parastrongyloides trichosuri TaxID=131310 RepID=A0A0N4ZR52_PARTI